jgi:hypothetical protein
MKKRYKFFPAQGYAHGSAASILRVLGVGDIQLNQDGTCEANVTDAELQMFNLRGGAHRTEEVVETPAAPVAPVEEIPAAVQNAVMVDQICPVPTLAEVLAAGYSQEAAESIVAQQQKIHDLLKSGQVAEAIALASGAGVEAAEVKTPPAETIPPQSETKAPQAETKEPQTETKATPTPIDAKKA